jgi:outer membrane lipoprotein LolB
VRPGTAALLALAALLLAGCVTPRVATVPEGAPDAARRAAVQALAGFSFRGQLAAAAGDQGFSATVTWQQRGADAQALLRGPLGVGSAQLAYDAAGLHYTGSDGTALEGAAAHAALERLLGFEPPLASLRYWLLAVPDPGQPAEERADVHGQPLSITQSGWQVDYADFHGVQGQGVVQGQGAVQGASLPGRVTLQRGALRLKLRISHWELA